MKVEDHHRPSKKDLAAESTYESKVFERYTFNTDDGSGGDFTEEHREGSDDGNVFATDGEQSHPNDEVLAVASMWAAALLSSILVGVICSGVHAGVSSLNAFRLSVVEGSLETGPFAGIVAAIGLTTVLAAIAAVPWFYDKSMSGSGLPEVISYLNGVDMEHIFRAESMLLCVFGCIAVCGSGLAVGYEGPLIRIGASVSYNVLKLFPQLRRDGALRRDMTAIGAGMGLSSAFKAPLAGTIFVFEELSATPLSAGSLLRTFVGCVCSYFTVYWLDSAPERVQTEFGARMAATCSYAPYWLPIFILIGIVGGVAGSAFNFLNLKASALRRTIRSPLLRAAELLALCLASALLFSSLPILFGCDGHKTAIALMDSENVRKLSTNEMVKCVTEKVSHQLIDNIDVVKDAEGNFIKVVRYLPGALTTQLDIENLSEVECTPRGSAGSYNPMASLFLVPTIEAGKTLMAQTLPKIFHIRHLLVAFIVYFLLAAVSAGAIFPSGLVLPHIFLGALLGRLVAAILDISGVNHGTMAICGAAAMLAGSGRIVLFLSVVMIEITGDITFAPPIAMTTIVAYVVANMFDPHGLYHALIHLKHIPFLSEPPDESKNVQCRQIMSERKLVCLLPEMRVSQAMLVIENTTHNVFPVVDHDGKLCGKVYRDDMERSCSVHEGAGQDATTVRKLMDPAPFALCHTQRAYFAYTAFVTIGLRQIIVTDESNRAIGVISRKDLMPWRFREALVREQQLDRRQGDQRVGFDMIASGADVGPDGIDHGGIGEAELGDRARGDGLFSRRGEDNDDVKPTHVNPLFVHGGTDADGGPSGADTSQSEYWYLRLARKRLPELRKVTNDSVAAYRFVERFETCERIIPLLLVVLTFFELPNGLFGRSAAGVSAVFVGLETLASAVMLLLGLLRQRQLNDSGWWLSVRLVCCTILTVDGIFSIILTLSGSLVPWGYEYNSIRPSRFVKSLLLIESARETRFIVKAMRSALKNILSVMTILISFVVMYAFMLHVMLRDLRPELGHHDFTTFGRSLKTMIVLLTTSNFPDVMLPYYDIDWWYSLVFLIFLLVSSLLLTNMFVAITVDSIQTLGKRHGLKIERRSTRLNLEAFALLARRRQGRGPAEVDDGTMCVLMDDYVRAETSGTRSEQEFQQVAKQSEALFRVLDEDQCGFIGPNSFLRLCEMQFFLKVNEWEDRKPVHDEGSGHIIGGILHSFSRSCRFFARKPSFELCVLGLILSDACLCIAEVLSDDRGMKGAHEFWIVLNCLYLLELLIRFSAFGFDEIFGDLIKTTETLVILISMPLSITEGNAQGLILLRVVRFFYVLNGISIFRPVLYWIHRIQKACRNAGAYMLVALSALFAFMVLGIVCFRDAIAVYPSEWDVTRYCSQAFTGGGVRLGCDRMDLLTSRACYLAGVSTVPCDFINPRLEGSAYSRDNFYHINFHSQQSALVTIMHLLFVNNWHITMNGFILATSEMAALYFILFYLFMVLFILNMFVAFVLTSFLSDGDDEEYVDALVRYARQRLEQLYPCRGGPQSSHPRAAFEVSRNERAIATVSKEHLRTAERTAETMNTLDAWYRSNSVARPAPSPSAAVVQQRPEGHTDRGAHGSIDTPIESEGQEGEDRELFPQAHSDSIGGLEL